MSEILISGYYGFNNAGDELILKAIISDLRSFKPDISITVLSAKPEETSKAHNVRSVNRWNILAIISETLNCKMLLSGSGGLFQDSTGLLSVWYYLLIISIAKIFRKKVFLYAVGVDSMKYSFNRFFLRYIFSHVDFITVRTSYDKELLQSFGIKKSITVTADPVFGIDLETSAAKDNSKKKEIGIIIRKNMNWQKDIEIFYRLAEILAKDNNAHVTFIPFQKPSDLKFLNILKERGTGRTEINIFFWKNTEELLKYFSQLDIVVSMRLHALILATKYGIPFFAIPRYSKVINFLHTIKEPAEYDENGLSAEYINKKIFEKLSDREKTADTISKILITLKTAAKKTAELCIYQLEKNEI